MSVVQLLVGAGLSVQLEGVDAMGNPLNVRYMVRRFVEKLQELGFPRVRCAPRALVFMRPALPELMQRQELSENDMHSLVSWIFSHDGDADTERHAAHPCCCLLFSCAC